jgi:uncharacterized DUF497 family protein
MKFTWDEEKRKTNLKKHGIDFLDVCRLFESPFLTIPDERLDYGEARFIAFGHVDGRLMAVAYTKRIETIRMISARKANSREEKRFRKEIEDRLEAPRRDDG